MIFLINDNDIADEMEVNPRSPIYTKKSAGRNKVLFDYIVNYKRRHDGIAPAIRDIKEALRYSSTSVVAGRLEELEQAGLIIRGEGNRNIAVVGGRWSYGA